MLMTLSIMCWLLGFPFDKFSLWLPNRLFDFDFDSFPGVRIDKWELLVTVGWLFSAVRVVKGFVDLVEEVFGSMLF